MTTRPIVLTAAEVHALAKGPTKIRRPVRLDRELTALRGDLDRAFADETYFKVLGVRQDYLHVYCPEIRSRGCGVMRESTVQRLHAPLNVGDTCRDKRSGVTVEVTAVRAEKRKRWEWVCAVNRRKP